MLAVCDNTLPHESPTLFLNSPIYTIEEKFLYVEKYLCGLKLSCTNNHSTHNHHVYDVSCNYFERGKYANSSHDSINNPLYVPKFAKLHQSNSCLSKKIPLLVTIMREEEGLILMFLCYLKYNLLIITCIAFHKIAVIYSYIKFQCIGKELDLKVNGLMFCGVLFMLLFLIRFGHTFIFLKHEKKLLTIL
jgi:hypothetical protein